MTDLSIKPNLTVVTLNQLPKIIKEVFNKCEWLETMADFVSKILLFVKHSHFTKKKSFSFYSKMYRICLVMLDLFMRIC